MSTKIEKMIDEYLGRTRTIKERVMARIVAAQQRAEDETLSQETRDAWKLRMEQNQALIKEIESDAREIVASIREANASVERMKKYHNR